MRRGRKPAKAKPKAKRPVARKPAKTAGSGGRDVEKRLAEALAQQAATSEILKVIRRSPANVQPVFDAIVTSGVALFDGAAVAVALPDDAQVRLGAIAEADPERAARWRERFPFPLTGDYMHGVAILDQRLVDVPDVVASDVAEKGRQNFLASGYRAITIIPMLREHTTVGTISVIRPSPGPLSEKQLALLKTFADQAVIAIENAHLFTELQVSNRELKTALETQTATSDILRVMSRSQTDVQPVFEAIVENATRLFQAFATALFLWDGQTIRIAATRGGRPLSGQHLATVDLSSMIVGRCIEDRRLIHMGDIESDPGATAAMREQARVRGFRSIADVPLMRNDQVIGVLSVGRAEARPFAPGEIALLETFADQAVIAIENVRLFTELQARNADLTEALEQQTATSEILRVISGSPTAVQPVFDTIVRNAVQLSGARRGALFRFDGELLHLVAHHNQNPEALAALQRAYPMMPTRAQVSGRAILGRRVAEIQDVLNDLEYMPGMANEADLGSLLAVPMLRADGAPTGVIVIQRSEPGTFAAGHVELLKTFADQAVIAIENVRLFNETREALEQQTATAEILRVISRSPSDVQPVFDAIVANASSLCDAAYSAVARLEDGLLHLVAVSNMSPEETAAYHGLFPRLPGRHFIMGRAFLERQPVHVEDIDTDPEYEPRTRQVLQRAAPYRTFLGVPILRDGVPIGAIGCGRREVKPFTAKQIELVKTFADQAVIAIENARLLNQLRERTAELTRSVNELTALGEVSRALSSTLNLDTVLTTIVDHAIQLSGGDAGTIWEYEPSAEAFHLRAARNFEEEIVGVLRAMPLRRGEGTVGRLADTLAPIQIADISGQTAYHGRLEVIVRSGYRAILSVPLLREDQLIGALTVNARTPREFPPAVVDLFTTFATQSALAIQNARLFLEIEQKSRELEIASQHKSEFLANMSHELRTPLNAIIGFSEVLTERMFGELNEKQSEYLKDIYASGQHLLSLINDILDLSKIEAGRMELELGEFDLPTAIENALTLIRERSERHGIAVHHSLDARLGQVQGDERKLKQVLLNLLSNAIKFTPEGGRIDVRAALVDGMAEVSVVDTGVGIAPEDQEAIFEEFRQVGTAAKTVEGTGLGLTLSRKFVELHGGRIWVQSQVGAGSTFTFTIPVRRGA